MTVRESRGRGWVVRLFLIGAAFTAAAAGVVAVRARSERRATEAARDIPVVIVAAAEPIGAEASVFLTSAATLSVAPSNGRSRAAHPRTDKTYRALRAYSGAPPRIPHGLTPAEYRSGGCATCHERGGFSQRFGAYVPVTPHPEATECLQCHVGTAALMAIALPRTDPSDRCRQCHSPGAMRWIDSTLDWKGLAPPTRRTIAKGVFPPPIPHDRQLHGNCLACHASPGAAQEIRTTHPERANCRQCHVEAGGRS